MKLLKIISTVITLIIIRIDGLRGNQGNTPSCGRRLVNHETLITNGFQSNEGAWPWHAAIFHYDIDLNIAYKCGGSIITSNVILTAAHCVYQNGRPIIPDRLLIDLGRHNLKIISVNTQQFEAFKIIPHPDYSKLDESNDIAIILLSTEATFNNYVQPICLWDSNAMDISEVVGRYGNVIGWGFTETDKLSTVLRQAVMPVVSFSTCLLSNRDFFGAYLSDKNFCAGFRNGTSVCNGDSGGSITFEDNGIYRIRGIVSVSAARGNESLCQTKEYVIFTDVAKYLPWIKDVVPELKGPQLRSGSRCSTRTTQPGICAGLFDCPSILDDLRIGIRNHVICGLNDLEQIVCCPSEQLDTMIKTRISVKKCKEYSTFAGSICSSTPVNEIIGVIEANDNEFPHMAQIGIAVRNYFRWSCGGTLISDQFVLSAASCVVEGDMRVRLGVHDQSRTRPSQVDMNVIESIVHPEYTTESLYNDVAVLKLERRLQFTSAIRPACLPEQLVVPTQTAISCGWATYKPNMTVSNVLLKVALDIFSQEECDGTYERSNNLHKGIVESLLCAGSYMESKGLCAGSGGGPLQILHEKYFCTHTIVGVNAFAKSCAMPGVPDVFTRVYSYLDWIEKMVWRNDDFDY